jgi:hypothetical protein
LKGLALDCVDVHDRRKDTDLDKTERYIYDCADKALDLIDLDDLYDKAEYLNIDIAYPEFYSFLNEKVMGLDEHELSDGNGGLLSDSDDEDNDGIEHDEDGDEKELSLGDSLAESIPDRKASITNIKKAMNTERCSTRSKDKKTVDMTQIRF